MEKWESCFWISTFPSAPLGAAGMWESQQRFPRAVGNDGKPALGFPRFPRTGNTWDFPDESKKNFAKYFEEKVKPQVRELLTNYGPIGLIWFDTPRNLSKQESQPGITRSASAT